MATVAFCGLGRKGEPMARRLVGADHELVVWNRKPEQAAALVDAGARRAGTPAEAADYSAVIAQIRGGDPMGPG